MSITVELSKEQWGVIIQMMNSIPGLENARVLLPIHDAIVAAVQKPEEIDNGTVE